MTDIRLIYFMALMTLVLACSRDLTERPDNSCGIDVDYSSYVKSVIDASCAYSGCHDGAGGAGPGNFNSYEGLQAHLMNGNFSSRVFDLKDNPVLGMPPDNAIDIGGEPNLDQETIDMLMAWANAGFPEESEAVVATYDENVREIIDTNCSYSGCHDGLGGLTDYTSFDGFQNDIDLGLFFERVVEIRDDPDKGMPPERADGPQDLTEEEYQLILCWIENGYPEN